MMETRQGPTPGPWMVKHAGMQDEIWSDAGLVAEFPLYPLGIAAVGANSQLCAAAPEMWNAAQAIKKALEVTAAPIDVMAALREVQDDGPVVTVDAKLLLALLEALEKAGVQRD